MADQRTEPILTTEQQADLCQHASDLVKMFRARGRRCVVLGIHNNHQLTFDLGQWMYDVADEVDAMLEAGEPAEDAGFNATQVACLMALDVRVLYHKCVGNMPSGGEEDAA